jgi:hypothetical protein
LDISIIENIYVINSWKFNGVGSVEQVKISIDEKTLFLGIRNYGYIMLDFSIKKEIII